MANSRFGLRTRPGLVRSYTEGTPATDPDATAFIDAAGITNTTIISAIQQLVIDLKLYSIWSKMKAIYPFVGGTASLHKWNLKDPRDLDAAFRLVFYGGITHSSTGAEFNGSNGYADSLLTPNVTLSQNNTHISFYSNKQLVSDKPFMGNSNDAQPQLNIFPTFSSQLYMRVNSAATASIISNTSSTGLFIANRVTSNETRNFQNTTLRTQSASSTGLANVPVLISRQASEYGAYIVSFASIGEGITDTQAANLYTSVQAFQTTLGRQI